jgi:hypothetical protein
MILLINQQSEMDRACRRHAENKFVTKFFKGNIMK